MRPITELRADDTSRLGNYRILRLLGRGGMGDVYLGWSGLRLVAIKLLHAHYASDATFVAMFLAEAKVAGRINHTGIAQVLDVGVDGGRLYMVMEYVAGHNLDELISEPSIPGTSLFPLRIGAAVFAFVAQALAAAHRAQVVHRDISPHNLLVSDTGAVKLIDFGIARTSTSELRTTPGTFRGRFGYMAPEYVQGQPCDHRVDLFALGVVMWETFARRRLYPGAAAAQLYAVIERPAERLDAVVPGFPKELADVVEQLLERDPEKRLGSAAQVAASLEAMLPQLPDDGFRNLAHWVQHHLEGRIEARAHADTEELQRIELENADPDIEILPSMTSAARYVGESSHTFSAVARPRRSRAMRWLPAVALGTIGVGLLTGAIWLFVSRSREPVAGPQATITAAPIETPLVPPQPLPPSAPPTPEVAPTATEPTPAPVAPTATEPTPEVAPTATEPTPAPVAAAKHPVEDEPSKRKKTRDKPEPRTTDRGSVAVIIAPRTEEEPPASPAPTPAPVPDRPAAPPVTSTIPVVPPPPTAPPAPPKTPRVPASMAGDEGAGASVVAECNSCHSKSKAKKVDGKQMTRSQWERFFRNGTHDRYLPLGDRMTVSKLAAAKAFLSSRALDASSDQGAGVR